LAVHADRDHHPSVYTLAGPDEDDAVPAARDLARAVAAQVSLAEHEGVHPRLGRFDYVQFVALGGTEVERARAAAAARGFGEWWAETHEVPVFFYDDADPEG